MSSTLSRKLRRVKLQRVITQDFGVQLKFSTDSQIAHEQAKIINAWRITRRERRQKSAS